jgi:hypothetical protein
MACAITRRGLLQRETGQRLDQTLRVLAREVDVHRLARLHRIDDAPHHAAALVLVGSSSVKRTARRRDRAAARPARR